MPSPDRKSTRLNSSHSQTSFAVFCLKKKKIKFCEILLEIRYFVARLHRFFTIRLPSDPHHAHGSLIPQIYFFFNDTATTEIYTLSLHDALPICRRFTAVFVALLASMSNRHRSRRRHRAVALVDRKSTRLNSSHSQISYAVF